MDDYRLIADSLATDIAAGRLRPGDQLPPQRRFARQRGIANSTAARVYSELVRRGLAVGEVGRGTFIRAGRVVEQALAEPASARVDLELNFSVLPGQAAAQAASLQRLTSEVLLPVGVTGTPAARAAAATGLARGGWQPGPEQIVFTGNGRQAVAASVAALVPVGGRLGVEAITYPVVKAVAARLGVTLVPLPMDEDGLIVDTLRTARVQAVYVQPTLHNPLGTTMSDTRRAELAEALRDLDIHAIEDGIYSFLRETSPLDPSRTIVVDSLSKRLAPGLTVGFAIAPPSLVDRVAAAVRAGGWAAQHYPLQAGTTWFTDGTVVRIAALKRADAVARQEIARARIPELIGDPGAYHVWWELPEAWRAETFVAAAGRRGIALTPAAAFAVVPGHAPNAVRLALSSPPLDVLTAAVDVLAALARNGPDTAFE
ncbi:PLP-dependent aminotransferase family protein [Actinocrispum wychmicini]|uniref:DNA-binding transcriptional MocR family regulator n=1 Tax=Actinocrispum wychmicini TaxID=1213861 RepID=A0A4R2IZA8_9PSEU|nr:PLP-dependent aminotransferase family protein [Actinocrispum wychmicini]TCO50637.1 DNA-binding transcriptional MocR family regulator [Actinocrispum wychmicini]